MRRFLNTSIKSYRFGPLRKKSTSAKILRAIAHFI